MTNFKPNPYFGANFWPILKNRYAVDIARLGTASGIAALITASLPPLFAEYSGKLVSGRAVIALCASSLLIFFSIFYHVEPEYLVFVVPLAILAVPCPLKSVTIMTLSAFPWVTKFLQGIQFKATLGRSEGKELFIRFYHLLFAGNPEAALYISQVAMTFILLFAAGMLAREAWKNDVQLP